MENVPCNLCGSSDSNKLYFARDNFTRERFVLAKCRSCGLVYTNPRPSADEMSRYYPHRLYPGDLAIREKQKILREFLQEGRILDVGCGRGFFLNSIKDRFEVMGIDRDNDSVLMAKKEFAINLMTGEVTRLPLPADSFDLITFWHSLEHLSAPKEALIKAFSLLKKGGLLIAATPNINSCQAKAFGKRWFHVDVPRHLYHFSETTLARILKDAGFSILDSSLTLFSHDFAGWWRSFFNVIHLSFEFIEKGWVKKMIDPRVYISKILGPIFYLPAYLLAHLENKKGKPGTIVFVAQKGDERADL